MVTLITRQSAFVDRKVLIGTVIVPIGRKMTTNIELRRAYWQKRPWHS